MARHLSYVYVLMMLFVRIIDATNNGEIGSEYSLIDKGRTRNVTFKPYKT